MKVKTEVKGKAALAAFEMLRDRLSALGFSMFESKKSTKTVRHFFCELRGRSPLFGRGESVMRLRTFTEIGLDVQLNSNDNKVKRWDYQLASQEKNAKGSGLHSKLVAALGQPNGGE